MYFEWYLCNISGTFEVRFQLFPNCGLIKSIIHSALVVVVELITTVTETCIAHIPFYFICDITHFNDGKDFDITFVVGEGKKCNF